MNEKELSGHYKRIKLLVHNIISKDADCRIEESEQGEIVINTGLVKKGKRSYRLANPEEQVDYMSEEEAIELENEFFNS